MSPPLPSSTLADRFAGLSSDVGREAEEAWLLKRMMLEWLAQILSMLAGLAAQFAAGTLPLPQPPQVARLAPAAPPYRGLKASVARCPGRALSGADNIQDEFPAGFPATGTSMPNQAMPASMRIRGPVRPSRGVGRRHLGFRLDWGEARRNGFRECHLRTSQSLRYQNYYGLRAKR